MFRLSAEPKRWISVTALAPLARVSRALLRMYARDVRQEPQPDGYTVREMTLAELDLLYREYSQPKQARAVRAKRTKKTAPKQKQKRRTKKRSRA